MTNEMPHKLSRNTMLSIYTIFSTSSKISQQNLPIRTQQNVLNRHKLSSHFGQINQLLDVKRQ